MDFDYGYEWDGDYDAEYDPDLDTYADSDIDYETESDGYDDGGDGGDGDDSENHDVEYDTEAPKAEMSEDGTEAKHGYKIGDGPITEEEALAARAEKSIRKGMVKLGVPDDIELLNQNNKFALMVGEDGPTPKNKSKGQERQKIHLKNKWGDTQLEETEYEEDETDEYEDDEYDGYQWGQGI